MLEWLPVGPSAWEWAKEIEIRKEKNHGVLSEYG